MSSPCSAASALPQGVGRLFVGRARGASERVPRDGASPKGWRIERWIPSHGSWVKGWLRAMVKNELGQ